MVAVQSFLMLAAGSAQLCAAHTSFTNFYVDGVNQGDGVAVRMNTNPAKATFPIDSISKPEMACGFNGEKAVSRVASINAGSTITFEWRDHPDASAPGAIDISHKGPCAVYMKKVDNSAADNNAAGSGWFKIMALDYDNSTKKWCTEKLEQNNGHLAVKVPQDLAPGYYLLRPELLALHQADKNPPDPQFYVGCAQIFLSSKGSSNPKNTVSIPGYVDINKTPGMTYNVWKQPLPLPYPQFGPPVYTSSGSKLRRDTNGKQTQTIGLKPDHCMISNANWCGTMPPNYTDQNGCWAASKNCSTQLTTCYQTAPPIGNKGCKAWEQYCTDIRNACSAANYQGPPPCDSRIPPKPVDLTGSVVSADGPQPSVATSATSTQGGKTASVPVQSSVTAEMSSAPPIVNKAAYAASPVAASDGSVTAGANTLGNWGSINECGSRNGQACQSGLCCSANGYCGTNDDYCNNGCQSQFGKCNGNQQHKRYHLRRSYTFGKSGSSI